MERWGCEMCDVEEEIALGSTPIRKKKEKKMKGLKLKGPKQPLPVGGDGEEARTGGDLAPAAFPAPEEAPGALTSALPGLGQSPAEFLAAVNALAHERLKLNSNVGKQQANKKKKKTKKEKKSADESYDAALAVLGGGILKKPSKAPKSKPKAKPKGRHSLASARKCETCGMGFMVRWGFFKDGEQRWRCNECFVSVAIIGDRMFPAGERPKPGSEEYLKHAEKTAPAPAPKDSDSDTWDIPDDSDGPEPAGDGHMCPSCMVGRIVRDGVFESRVQKGPKGSKRDGRGGGERWRCLSCRNTFARVGERFVQRGRGGGVNLGARPDAVTLLAAAVESGPDTKPDAVAMLAAALGQKQQPRTAAPEMQPPPHTARARESLLPLRASQKPGEQVGAPRKRIKVVKYVKGGAPGATGSAAGEPANKATRAVPGQYLDEEKFYSKRAKYFNALASPCDWGASHEALRGVSEGGASIQAGMATSGPTEVLEGKRIAVFYEEENMFFPGTVVGPPDAEGLSPVDLDRGTAERLLLVPVKLYTLSSVALMGCPEFQATVASKAGFTDQRVAVYNSRTNALHLGTVAGREGDQESTNYTVIFDDGLALTLDFDSLPVYWLGGKAKPLAGPGMNGVSFQPDSQKFIAQAPGVMPAEATEHLSADAAALACDLQVIRGGAELDCSSMNSQLARRPLGVLGRGRTRRLAVVPWALRTAKPQQPLPSSWGGAPSASEGGRSWSQVVGAMGRSSFRLQPGDFGFAQASKPGSKVEASKETEPHGGGAGADRGLEEAMRLAEELKVKKALRDEHMATLEGILKELTAQQRHEALDRQKIFQIGLRVDALEREGEEIRQRIIAKERELEELTCLGLDQLRGGPPAA